MFFGLQPTSASRPAPRLPASWSPGPGPHFACLCSFTLYGSYLLAAGDGLAYRLVTKPVGLTLLHFDLVDDGLVPFWYGNGAPLLRTGTALEAASADGSAAPAAVETAAASVVRETGVAVT